jgi:hypothetical protein
MKLTMWKPGDPVQKIVRPAKVVATTSTTAERPVGLRPTADPATWPVPCPDCGDQGHFQSAVPGYPGQRHHWLCVFWDATGVVPF